MAVPVWVPTDSLRDAVGVQTGGSDFVALCCILGTQWVKARVGVPLDTDPVADAPVEVVYEPTTIGRRQAALSAAVRFYNSPQAPFGVLGSGDAMAYVSGKGIPEADLALAGERTEAGAHGIA